MGERERRERAADRPPSLSRVSFRRYGVGVKSVPDTRHRLASRRCFPDTHSACSCVSGTRRVRDPPVVEAVLARVDLERVVGRVDVRHLMCPPAGTTFGFVSLYTRPVVPFAWQFWSPVMSGPVVGPNSLKTTLPPAGSKPAATDDLIEAESCGNVYGAVLISSGSARPRHPHGPDRRGCCR